MVVLRLVEVTGALAKDGWKDKWSIMKQGIQVGVLAKSGSFCSHLQALLSGHRNVRTSFVYHTMLQAKKEIPLGRPEVLVLDLETVLGKAHPAFDHTAYSLIAHFGTTMPELRMVVLTHITQHETVVRLLEAGAQGCLAKPVDPMRFVKAIDEVYSGGAPMCFQVSRIVVQELHNRGAQQAALTTLTVQERKVLRLMSEGLNRHEIASCLNISPFTASTHFRNIFEKLNVHSQAQAVARYFGHELSK